MVWVPPVIDAQTGISYSRRENQRFSRAAAWRHLVWTQKLRQGGVSTAGPRSRGDVQVATSHSMVVTWWHGPSWCYHTCSPSQHWPCSPGWRKHFCLSVPDAILIVFATILIAIKQACTSAFLMLSVKKKGSALKSWCSSNCLAVVIDGWRTLAWFKHCSSCGLSDPPPICRTGVYMWYMKVIGGDPLSSSGMNPIWAEKVGLREMEQPSLVL